MTLLLNYLPYIIFAIGAYVAYKQYKKYDGDTNQQYARLIRVGLVVAALQLLLMALTPSYMPTGKATRVASPPFYTVGSETLEAEDRLRKPRLSEEEAQERFNTITDWRSSVAPEKD